VYGEPAWQAGPVGAAAGCEFRARFLASGWEGTGRVEACEPRRRLLLLLTGQPGQSYEHAIEVTLATDGDHTLLVWEERLITRPPASPMTPQSK
jgi:hypothetical protein